MSALGAGVLRGEVEGHHLGAASGNLGLDDSGIFTVLVHGLIVHIEEQPAAITVGTVVLHSHMALLGQPYLFATGELKVGGLEVDNRMVGQGNPVTVDGSLDVVTVALDHGIPNVAARNAAHRHNLVGAVREIFAEGVGN